MKKGKFLQKDLENFSHLCIFV